MPPWSITYEPAPDGSWNYQIEGGEIIPEAQAHTNALLMEAAPVLKLAVESGRLYSQALQKFWADDASVSDDELLRLFTDWDLKTRMALLALDGKLA